jgi:prolyl oligopeptidase
MTLSYPDTRTEDAWDTLAGVSFPDPYRWLEQDSDEVRQWQEAQAKLASAHVREWPRFDQLRQLVARFSIERFVPLPRYAAGLWFRTHMADGSSQAEALVANEPMGEGRVLFNPITEDAVRPPFLSWIAPSPDGRTLALGVCSDGSEKNTIRLIDVVSGEALADPPPQPLMDNWTGGVQWLPDSSGFFFTAMTGAAGEMQQQVYLHRRSPGGATTTIVDVPWVGEKEYRMVTVCDRGRYLVALERLFNPIPVAVAELDVGALRWRRFVGLIGHTVAGHIVGDRYIAVTDLGAPRGRLVSIALDAPNASDPESWQELVSESDAVLRAVTPIGEALYLTEFVDAYARLRIVDVHGSDLGEVPLPGCGAISQPPFPMMNLARTGHSEKFLFAFSSLTQSPGIYSHTLGQPAIETLQPPRVLLENAVVETRWAVSADGTRIPYHLVRRGDVTPSRPQPTLIYAYGGFNYPLVPQFPGPMASFVAVGGVFVHAHLRGGGEFGVEWWQGGRLGKKQNSYDDLYAVAEDLIRANLCTSQSLAITGHSNGGLLAGVAVTQRPDLWAVAIPRVPRLDLIGACRDAYGRMSTLEDRADPEDPNEVRRLATFSPYHLVRPGVDYPAVFLEAGATDPRCPAWHARKFAARLQCVTKGHFPILLHVWENAGHGLATEKNTAITQNTEWLAFTLRHLGVSDWVP